MLVRNDGIFAVIERENSVPWFIVLGGERIWGWCSRSGKRGWWLSNARRGWFPCTRDDMVTLIPSPLKLLLLRTEQTKNASFIIIIRALCATCRSHRENVLEFKIFIGPTLLHIFIITVAKCLSTYFCASPAPTKIFHVITVLEAKRERLILNLSARYAT